MDLRVIDVLDHPQLAEDQKVIATPTLIKEVPPPPRRLIGDFSDKETVLLMLDLPRPDRAEQVRDGKDEGGSGGQGAGSGEM